MKMKILPCNLKFQKEKVISMNNGSILSNLRSGIVFLLMIMPLFLSNIIANDVKEPKEDIMLTEALHKLSQKFEVFFSYDETSIANVEVQYQPEMYTNVEHALDELLAGTVLKYKIFDNRYIILYAESKEAISSLKGMVRHLETVIDSQEKSVPAREKVIPVPLLQRPINYQIMPLVFSVSGTVTDENGDPLIGVNIQVKGMNTGTATDFDGHFTLEDIDDNAVLVVSYIGYQTQEIPLAGKSTVSIVLVSDSQLLDEVVVVGYGTQKKTSVTASVSSMGGEEIAKIPITDISNSLGGRLAGVVTKQTDGEPGRDGSRINIRGISTIGSSAPLLIVDGVPRSFQQLDQNSIESITVLKDASAVAPYGVAGANGVVLVTTKIGQQEGLSLSYHGYAGFQNYTILPDQTDSYNHALLRNMANENAGIAPAYDADVLQKLKDGSDPDRYPPYYDLYGDLMKKNSPLTKHTVDISGGTDKVKFYGGLGYMFQDGLWNTEYIQTNAKQYNLTMNVDAQATETTKISFKLNGSKKDYVRPPSDLPGNGTGRIFELVKYAHFEAKGPLWYSNGLPGAYVSGALATSGSEDQNDMSIYSQFSIEQEIPFIDGLKLSGTFAYDPTFSDFRIWETPVHLASLDISQTPYVVNDEIWGNDKATLDERRNKYEQLTSQFKLDYRREFGNHDIGLLGVFEAISNKSDFLRSYRKDFEVLVSEINLGSPAGEDMQTGGGSSEAKQVGLVYRLNYDYLDKYLVEFSGRYDGHYYFAPGKRWGFFPAASVGWRVSEEGFLKDKISWLYNLKVRGSYGEVGALAGGAFQYLTLYSLSGPGYAYGGSGVSVAREGNEPNKDITWERARKANVGIELSVLKGKFNLEADYFYEKRSNMLVAPTVTTSYEYGIGLSQVNAGIMSNKGIELLADFNQPITKDLSFQLMGTFSYAKNKILEIFETDATFNNPERRLTGRPLGSQFGYNSLGYFQVNDFDAEGNLKPGIATQPWGKVYPGDIRYEDINGDGKIDVNGDYTMIGKPSTPEIIYGLSPTISFKDLSLNLFFQGTENVNFYFNSESVWPFHGGRNTTYDHFDSWTPDNTNARHPRITPTMSANNIVQSSHWMQDVSYLRLKNATLSYNLPSKIIRAQNIVKNLNVFVSGTNLLTWTKLINIDPEIEYNRGNTYPQQKVVSIGVNATF